MVSDFDGEVPFEIEASSTTPEGHDAGTRSVTRRCTQAIKAMLTARLARNNSPVQPAHAEE